MIARAKICKVFDRSVQRNEFGNLAAHGFRMSQSNPLDIRARPVGVTPECEKLTDCRDQVAERAPPPDEPQPVDIIRTIGEVVVLLPNRPCDQADRLIVADHLRGDDIVSWREHICIQHVGCLASAGAAGELLHVLAEGLRGKLQALDHRQVGE